MEFKCANCKNGIVVGHDLYSDIAISYKKLITRDEVWLCEPGLTQVAAFCEDCTDAADDAARHLCRCLTDYMEETDDPVPLEALASDDIHAGETMIAYGIWCEETKQWSPVFPGRLCNMFVGESELPIALAVYNNMRNDRALAAQRGGYFCSGPPDENKRREAQAQYEATWLKHNYSVRGLGRDGKPTSEILASGPLMRETMTQKVWISGHCKHHHTIIDEDGDERCEDCGSLVNMHIVDQFYVKGTIDRDVAAGEVVEVTFPKWECTKT